MAENDDMPTFEKLAGPLPDDKKLDESLTEDKKPEMTKKTPPRRMFKMYWQNKFPWLLPGLTDVSPGFCKFCKRSRIQLRTSSFVQHETTTKHKKNERMAMTISNTLETDENIDVVDKSYSRLLSKSGIGKDERKIVTKDAQIYFIKCPADIPGCETVESIDEDNLSEYYVNQVARDVSNRFIVDLKSLLKRNTQLAKLISDEKSTIYLRTAGLQRLKKVLVGHMAQYYLIDSTTSLWMNNSEVENRQAELSSKIENIALQLDRSMHAMKSVKSTLTDVEQLESLSSGKSKKH